MEENWHYRGEGNASIVIACLKKRVVYKIGKVNSAEVDEDVQSLHAVKPCSRIEFVENVMRSLISSQFLIPLKIVKVPDGLIEAIQTSLKPLRPDFRLCKSVSLDTEEVIEMPDLCFIGPTDGPVKPTYTIELKPKWGFLSVFDNVSDVKKTNCRFCMHQTLKLMERKWLKKSSYCPIDLFSGCHARMKYALRSLYSCPQNNFCIYKDGQQIWCNKSIEDESSLSNTTNDKMNKLVDELFDVVIQCLSYPNKDSASQKTNPQQAQSCKLSTCGHVCDAGCSKLSTGSVLADLLNIQCLDHFDIEGLFPHFVHVCDAFQADSQLSELCDMDGPYVSSWLETPYEASLHSSIIYSIHKVKQYLVSRSAKDCSIFVTVTEVDSESVFQESNVGTFFVSNNSGRRYLCRVSVIDLDPKSFSKIPFYLTEDKKVVDCFQKSVQQDT